MNNYEALIPISAFIATALVIIVFLYLSHKNKYRKPLGYHWIKVML